MARARGGYAPALALAGAVLALDQLSKWLVRRQAAELPLDLGWVRLHLTFNSGISFSRLADAGRIVPILVAGVAAGVAIALAVAPARFRVALGVILGGALGNLIDRLRFGGAVVDFIAIYRWPSFNVADAAIAVGAVLLVLQVIRGPRS